MSNDDMTPNENPPDAAFRAWWNTFDLTQNPIWIYEEQARAIWDAASNAEIARLKSIWEELTDEMENETGAMPADRDATVGEIMAQVRLLKDQLAHGMAWCATLTTSLAAEKKGRQDAIAEAAELRRDAQAIMEYAKAERENAIAIMRRENLVIANHDDPYQKLAFTFYTMLVSIETNEIGAKYLAQEGQSE